MTPTTNVYERYKADGPGKDTYLKVKELIKPRLTVAGFVTTSDVYYLCRIAYSYSLICGCFANIMNEMVLDGTALRISKGKWYILEPGQDPQLVLEMAISLMGKKKPGTRKVTGQKHIVESKPAEPPVIMVMDQPKPSLLPFYSRVYKTMLEP